MPTKKKFKMRKMPEMPVRHKVAVHFFPEEGKTLRDILAYYADAFNVTVTPGEVFVEDVGYVGGVYFTYWRDQTDDEFAIDVEAYERRLAAYKVWYEKNRVAADAYLKEERATKLAEMRKRVKKAQDGLNKAVKELAKLEDA